MSKRFRQTEPYLVPVILLIVMVVDIMMVFLSDGTHGGADDVNHYQMARYSWQHPHLLLNLWGKPFFTAIMSPFAQFGFNGVRIFNVLVGTATAWFTYRTALKLKISTPVIAIFLLLSSPLYTVLMISGMTEILFSLMLILSIYLFFKKRYIWSAVILSFIPFVRTEGVVIIPLFLVALAWQRQWKAIPFLALGLVFYSFVGSFYYHDLLWVIHKMPYSGNARDIYGSGELLHYVKATKFIFGIPFALLVFIGGLAWIIDPLIRKERVRKDWLMEMLVVYLPFFVYYLAHSYVWWKGMGNSVGMIRVIVAVAPSAAVLGAFGWSRLMELIPVEKGDKHLSTAIVALFLLTIPYKTYQIPVPLEGTQPFVKQASDWIGNSSYAGKKFYYFNPFFPHFMKVNPYDESRAGWFIPDRQHPEQSVKEGEIVIWDAHFGPNEGRIPLERLMDNEGFRLVHLTRDKEPFTVLGGYLYEIYIFQRISTNNGTNYGTGTGTDNHDIYNAFLEEILHPPPPPPS